MRLEYRLAVTRLVWSCGLAALFVCAACDDEASLADAEPAEEGPLGKADGASNPLIDGTPEAVGVLRLLNSPETTFDMLDHDAALDRRAAQNLIAHRNGSDEIYEEGAPDSDDDRFDEIQEVDDVAWVGPVALERLRSFALQMDFVPGGNQPLGVWEGVEFTVDEAAAALQLVNTASEAELHDVLHDSRPVDSIVEARPLAAIPQLAELYYVGPVMLGRIAAAVESDGTGEACSEDDPCPSGLACMGRADGIGLCRDLSNIPGQGHSCSAQSDCQPNLVCTGLTIFTTGTCNPDWMAATFTSGSVASIPQDMPFPMGFEQTVRGLASVAEDIVVVAHLDHSDPHSLQIVLEDPNGNQDMLWNGPSMGVAPFPEQFLSLGIPRDDEINGQWTLFVQNVEGQGEGVLNGWELHLTSRFD